MIEGVSSMLGFIKIGGIVLFSIVGVMVAVAPAIVHAILMW
tara:strand:+ start:254 stop:376 length:123 start_codon:yes stop_codon:yes gene_type:complete